MTALLIASRAVEFLQIFINTLAGLMFAANLIAVAVFVCRSQREKTEAMAANYFKRAVVSLWVAAACLFLFYVTREWGIQIW